MTRTHTIPFVFTSLGVKQMDYIFIGSNIFVSSTEYIERDWVRLKVRHYPLQTNSLETKSVIHIRTEKD